MERVSTPAPSATELGPHPSLSDRHALAIVSPANRGRLLEIESDLGVVFPNLECVAPGSLDDLGRLVRESQGHKDLLIAVGGDGTLHQVLQHVDLPTQVLGLLPGGTGNDLARTLGFPLDFRGRVGHLLGQTPVSMDLGLLGGVRFHNSGGFGLDTATLVVREQRHGLFKRNYNAAFVAALVSMRPLRGEVEIDGRRHSGRFWWVLAMNNRDIGKGTQIAPRAVIDDGRLDILLVEGMSKLDLLRLLPRAQQGRHIGQTGVTYEQAERVTVRLDKPLTHIACDGELYASGASELHIEILPNALKLLR